MDKEKQIEEIAKILWSDCGDCTECLYFHKEINGVDACYFKYAEMIYNAGYRKQSEPISCTHENGCEWISVEDRFPEENGQYLASVAISHLAFENLTTIAIVAYGKSHGFYLYNETEKVTHWMPLPKPPKMKGGEADA